MDKWYIDFSSEISKIESYNLIKLRPSPKQVLSNLIAVNAQINDRKIENSIKLIEKAIEKQIETEL